MVGPKEKIYAGCQMYIFRWGAWFFRDAPTTLYRISCENYLSSWKCATTPELFKVCNANGKVKNSTKL